MSLKLLKSGTIVSGMTLISRVLGLVRDVVLAHLVGATAHADVFLLAQKIPNFLRRLFAEGAFSQAFVPVLNETLVRDGAEGVKSLVDRVAGTLGAILLGLTVMAILGSKGVASLFGMGFVDEPDKLELLSLLIKITFPYLLFISLTAFSAGVLNSHDRFAVAAFTPVFLNLSLIASAIWVAPHLTEPVLALAWAVFAAGVLQLLFQLPFLWQLGLLPRPTWGWRDARVQKILKLMTPALFGVSVTQINLLLDSILASFLVTGSISWLYYSDRLLEFPLGVFGIAIATVILPTLSRQHNEASADNFAATLSWAIRMVLMVGIPATAGLVVLSEPLMLTLFQRGAFTVMDARSASASLIAYALGLNAFMLIKVLAPGYFSRQDTRTPVKIGVVAMVSNMVLNLSLFWWLGHVGLALATSTSAAINAGLLWRGLRRRGFGLGRGLWPWLAKVMVATSVMVAGLLVLQPEQMQWEEAALLQRLTWLVVACVSAIGAYGLVLAALGVRTRDLSGHG
jgi:putative peptidoglycan lipid II flippase